MSDRRLVKDYLALAILLMAFSTGGAPALAAEPAPEEGVEAKAAAAAPQGVVVSWDLENRRFRPPTPAQRARISEALQALFGPKEGEKAAETGEAIVIERLESGAVKAPLPLSHLHTSVVRFDGAGEPAGFCADDPRRVRQILERPAPSAAVEE